jgi:hypothetical protein
MRCVNTTAVNVQVNDRQDRTNVVATLRGTLRHSRLYLRAAGISFAKCKRERLPGWQAMVPVAAVSPSWGGHRITGRSGESLSS